jgi:hypothetical protein
MKRNCVIILYRARLAGESGNPFQDGGQIHEYAMLKLSVFQGVFLWRDTHGFRRGIRPEKRGF